MDTDERKDEQALAVISDIEIQMVVDTNSGQIYRRILSSGKLIGTIRRDPEHPYSNLYLATSLGTSEPYTKKHPNIFSLVQYLITVQHF